MSGPAGKILVLIPTTTGPVQVLRLTEEDPAIGRSVACIGGGTQTADIDAGYSAFVARPTGVVERLFGHPSYRLDVSERIDAGSSWQLGVLTAHALRAAGRLAGEHDNPSVVVWVTGSVRSVDMTVGGVSHLGEKFALSLGRLEQEVQGGRSVLTAVPTANAAEITPEIRDKLAMFGVEVIEVASVESLWSRLDLSPAAAREQRAVRRQLKLRAAIAGGMAALALVAGAAAWTALRQSLEAERRLAIALKASGDTMRLATDFKERFGVTAPQTTLHLEGVDATLQLLSASQAQGVSLAEIKRTLMRLFENVGDTAAFRHQKAQVLIALSESYGTLGRTREQLANAVEARTLLQDLLKREGADSKWERDLGRAHVAEGDALQAQGKGKETLASYTQALKVRIRLTPSGTRDLEQIKDLASSLARVADILAARGDYDEAQSKFNETLKILQGLAAMEPGEPKRRRDMAAAHVKIGDALSSRGDATGALASFRESERILTELVAIDAKNTRWLRELGVSKERVGDILLDRADRGGALAAYEASLKLRLRLAESDRNNILWQVDLAYAHNKMADALAASNLRAALAKREKALAVIEGVLSSGASAEVRRALLAFHLRLGDNLQQLGDTLAAANHFQTALEQAEFLVASDTTSAEWRDGLAVAIERLAENLGARGQSEAALANLKRAERLRMELVALDSGRKDWRRNLAMLQRIMSSVLERKGDLEDALWFSHAALDAVEKLARADPASRTFQRDISVLHVRTSELLWKEGRYAPAIEHLHKSLAVLEAGSETAGQEWQWGLVATRTQLADRLFAQKQTQIAEEQLGRAKSLAERLHDSDPSNTGGAVALYTIYARIGRIAQTNGKSEQALGALQRCHDLVADLVKRDPRNHGWQLDLALTYHSIGELLEPVRSRRAEALSSHVKAVRMLEALSRSDTANPILQRTLADAHRRIVTLLAETGDRNGEARALRAGLTTLQRLTQTMPDDSVLAQTLAWFEQRHRQLSGGSR